ncbi:maleylpyruvate isomerase family mycothiol-dependent enzyme [Pseudonocardia sp. GCM10023141]|uniref:maleylpyruvate isomerase family mycothiol-dependent enzyme n=1 Tax=Pseudonocardia sp. GCM10023141 TaxID=3252653 RepID=UPI00361B49EF
MVDVWSQIAAERRELADFLETLAPADWDVPSLCPGWAVRDVVAHIVWGPGQPWSQAMLEMLKGGFRINHVTAATARRWGRRPTAEMITGLREREHDRSHSPIITDTHVLADIVCHNLDIRRPLARSRAMSPPAFRATADLMASTGPPLDIVFARSPRRTVRDLRLVADDLDWTHGSGAEVRGTAEALLMVITGRPVAHDELTGPGAAQLRARIGR